MFRLVDIQTRDVLASGDTAADLLVSPVEGMSDAGAVIVAPGQDADRVAIDARDSLLVALATRSITAGDRERLYGGNPPSFTCLGCGDRFGNILWNSNGKCDRCVFTDF